MAYASEKAGLIDTQDVKVLAALLNAILTINGSNSDQGEEEEEKTEEEKIAYQQTQSETPQFTQQNVSVNQPI